MIGADAPQLISVLLRAAATDDPHTPFVIGNALDGGFWLFGVRVSIAPRHWQAVGYSQPDTTRQLRAPLQDLGGIAELQRPGDVDTVDDIPMLQRQMTLLDPLLPEQRELAQWLAQLPETSWLDGAKRLFERSPYSKENLT